MATKVMVRSRLLFMVGFAMSLSTRLNCTGPSHVRVRGPTLAFAF